MEWFVLSSGLLGFDPSYKHVIVTDRTLRQRGSLCDCDGSQQESPEAKGSMSSQGSGSYFAGSRSCGG